MAKLLVKDLIAGGDSRCLGERVDLGWGYPDTVCAMRETCRRFLQMLIDLENYVPKVPPLHSSRYTGWACATDDKEMRIPASGT